jgi:hypothetical protein
MPSPLSALANNLEFILDVDSYQLYPSVFMVV